MNEYYIPVSTERYPALFRSTNSVFVDKSLFISDLFKKTTDDDVLLITRPRRWGKSLNLSMLHHFLASEVDGLSTKGLFDDKKIAEITIKNEQGETVRFIDQHQGQYPVIYLNFKNIPMDNHQTFQSIVYNELKNITKSYHSMINSDRVGSHCVGYVDDLNDFAAGTLNRDLFITIFRKLCIVLSSYTGKNVWILIDEYDAPINNSVNTPYHSDIVEFMRFFLGSALKGNPALDRAVITGILRIAKANLFSDLNNVLECSFFDRKYREYFGFTEAEIAALLQKLAVEDIDTHLSTIRDWYNGYNWYDQAHTNWPLYNPWSVMNYLHALQASEPQPAQAYWCESGGGALIRHSLVHCKNAVKAQFSQLLQPELTAQKPLELAFHKQVSLSDLQSDKGFWSLLFHSGYVTPQGPMWYRDSALHCHTILPNFEVLDSLRGLLESVVLDFQADELITHNFMQQLLCKGDIQAFESALQQYLKSSISYFDVAGTDKLKEQIYHVFMLGLVAHLHDTYMIKSNREGGSGRYDLVLIPKDTQHLGVIMEFKSIETTGTSEGDRVPLQAACQAALQQIQDKSYATELDSQSVTKHCYLGIAFAKKNVQILGEWNAAAEQSLVLPHASHKRALSSSSTDPFISSASLITVVNKRPRMDHRDSAEDSDSATVSASP